MFLCSMDSCQDLIKAEKISIYIGSLTAWKYYETFAGFQLLCHIPIETVFNERKNLNFKDRHKPRFKPSSSISLFSDPEQVT